MYQVELLFKATASIFEELLVAYVNMVDMCKSQRLLNANFNEYDFQEHFECSQNFT